MASIELVGGITAEIKCETQDVVEIKLGDILNNDHDGEGDPVIVADNDSLYPNQPENPKNTILEDVNLLKSDFGNDLGKQIFKQDKENVVKIKDNNDKSSREPTTKANTQTKEKLILNYTANKHLLENNNEVELEANKDFLENKKVQLESNEDLPEKNKNKEKLILNYTANKDLLENNEVELEANEDLLENNKKVQLESNEDLPEKNKKVELEPGKKLIMPFDWSEIYRTHEGTCTNQDTCKVKVTRVPTAYVSCTEYTVEGLNKFRCNHCQHVTNRRKNLTRHIRIVHRNVTNTYQCPYCPFKSKYRLNSHIISMHKSVNEIEWFRCGQCDYKSKLKTTLAQHLLTHLDSIQMIDRMKRCDLCPKMYRTGEALKRHVLYCHRKDEIKKLKCTDCEYECISALQLRNHRDAYHTDLKNVKILQCPKCSYKTKISHNLDRHTRAVHKNTYQCEKCAYQTNNIGKIKLHLISHKEIKDDADLRYRCDKCDYKTYRQYSLNVHKLNHLKPEEIQFFYCYHCNFKAKRKDNLKTHVLRHFKRNEVTSQCYICDFSTTKKHLLISHIDKHSKIMKDIKPEKIVTRKTTQINEPAISTIDNHLKVVIDVENQKTKFKKPNKMANVKTRISARIKQQEK